MIHQTVVKKMAQEDEGWEVNKLYLTGYSLGGSKAMILAELLLLELAAAPKY